VESAERARGQAEVNAGLWRRADLVPAYANRVLRPVEVMLLVRHRDELSGRVLELGCGAGRLTGYLGELSSQVTATDVSPHMLEAAGRRYPGVRFEQRDLRDLSGFEDGSFDVIVAGYNLLDVLDDETRRATLAEAHRILVPGGLLVFSGHNLEAAWRRRTPWQHILARNPVRLALNLLTTPRRLRNRARVRPLEHRADDHALLNDESHDFLALHYYIAPEAQTRQLEAAGFTVLERLDVEGNPLAPGDPAAHAEEVHYVARREEDGLR
jgi:SAM-dependent methyltransferase